MSDAKKVRSVSEAIIILIIMIMKLSHGIFEYGCAECCQGKCSCTQKEPILAFPLS